MLGRPVALAFRPRAPKDGFCICSRSALAPTAWHFCELPSQGSRPLPSQGSANSGLVEVSVNLGLDHSEGPRRWSWWVSLDES